MKVQWKKLLVKTTFWLVAEIWFNFLGIDNLVDYGEFVFAKPEITFNADQNKIWLELM